MRRVIVDKAPCVGGGHVMKNERRKEEKEGGRGKGHKGYRIKVIRVVLRLLMPKGGWRLTGRSV